MSIALNHITLSYGSRTLLEDVTAAFAQGSLTALIGRNGTGKSTLLRAIAGLGTTVSGDVALCGRPLASLTPHELSTTVGFVTTDKVRIANLACEDVVALGRAPYTNWIGRMQEADRAVVERSLRLVGMSAFARKTMDRMSDGECQRVMIARALAQDTPVILLDEPTAFLDLPNRYELAADPRRGQVHPLLDARPRRGALALRLGGADRHPFAPPPPCGGDGRQRTDRASLLGRKRPLRPRDADRTATLTAQETTVRGTSGKKSVIFSHIFCTSHFFAPLFRPLRS